MKALSIKQPWAWLICKGIKDVENRTWWLHMSPLLNHPSYAKNVPMRMFVHASLSKSEMSKDILASILRHLSGRQASEFMLVYERLSFGAIVGEVDVVGCKYRFSEENDNLYSVWHEIGMYGLLLANPALYDEPIPCKGKLGFFEPELAAKRCSQEVMELGL